MANEFFPIGASQLALFPKLPQPSEGLQSFRLNAPFQLVQVSDGELQPVQAVRLDCGAEPTNCADPAVLPWGLNDCASRVAIYLTAVEVVSPAGSPVVVPFANPVSVVFEVRFAAQGVSETMYQGSFQVQTLKEKGLLVQVSGLLATQFELWARVDTAKQQTEAHDLRLKFQFLADRMGDTLQAHAGVLAGGVPFSSASSTPQEPPP